MEVFNIEFVIEKYKNMIHLKKCLTGKEFNYYKSTEK